MNCVGFFDYISVNVLVGHAEVVLAGLLTTANPLHAVLPPLDVAFQEDPSVAEEIVLGKIRRVFGVGARLVHAHETLGKVNVPCPLGRDVLLGPGHHCHRRGGRVVILEEGRRE